MVKHLTDKFYVISVVSNPMRYNSRYNLFKKFAAHMDSFVGANHFVVELAYGRRKHQIDAATHKLSSETDLWHKENLVNLGISRLPSDWEYVAWIDADISFTRNDWVTETIHELQRHQVVQLFETAIDLGPTGQAFQTHTSFGSVLRSGKPMFPDKRCGYTYPHPGFAWAMRRSAFDTLGGLLDKAICGSGDHHMCWGLLGKSSWSCPKGLHPNYYHMVNTWGERAKLLKSDVGFVNGTILHDWHGKKQDRQYMGRWEILKRHQYDPYADIYRDWQGVYQLTEGKPALRDDLRAYFRARNEDSIEF